MNDITRDSSRTQSGGHQNALDSRGINFSHIDPDLGHFLRLHLGDASYRKLEPRLKSLGQCVSDEPDAWATSMDHNPPQLHHRTCRGEALQTAVKHPDYATLERVVYAELGLASVSHVGNVPPPLVKYAPTYLFVQAEFGLCCPISMAGSLTRTLRKFGDPALLVRYLPMLASRDFDVLYQGAMLMAEQVAGLNVACVTTRAALETAPDGMQTWRLYGDKWFCPNADADLAMVLARPDGALSGTSGFALFLLPKTLRDDSCNYYRIVRLKNKLGICLMASGETALEGVIAYLIGEIGRGFHQMVDIINMPRLSNSVCAADLMRRATTGASYIARNREVLGRKLIDMPLMQCQFLKTLLPTEQARSMFMQIARPLPLADTGDAQATKCVHTLTLFIKSRVCCDAHRATGDVMEVRGGTDYIEEWSGARLVHDAHLGSIWEGTSNIITFGIAHAVKREGALEPLRAYLVGLLDGVTLPAQSGALLRAMLDRVCRSIVKVAEDGSDEFVCQVGSALYHITAAIFMAVEGILLAPGHRHLALTYLVPRHELLPVDPLASPASDDGLLFDSFAKQREVPSVLAMRALPVGEAQ